MNGGIRNLVKLAFGRFTALLGETVFPRKCCVCGFFFDSDTRGETPDVSGIAGAYRSSMSALLCPECLAGFEPVESPLCVKCGMMFKSRSDRDHLCGNCLSKPAKFGTARASGVYRGQFGKAIRRFKYNGNIQLAGPLGDLLYSTFALHWDVRDIDLVAPVPLHPRRLRSRRFNQAYLLFRRWPCFEDESGLPIRIERDALVRIRWTEPQVSVGGYEERISNIRNAFGVAHPSRIKGKRILLVDDVLTTGATAGECAGVLLKAGAEKVDVLTLARTA